MGQDSSFGSMFMVSHALLQPTVNGSSDLLVLPCLARRDKIKPLIVWGFPKPRYGLSWMCVSLSLFVPSFLWVGGGRGGGAKRIFQ